MVADVPTQCSRAALPAKMTGSFAHMAMCHKHCEEYKIKQPLNDKTAMLCSSESVPNLVVMTVQFTLRRSFTRQKKW